MRKEYIFILVTVIMLMINIMCCEQVREQGPIPVTCQTNNAIINPIEISLYKYSATVTTTYEDRQSLCSGTLIAPNIILTAGHCVFGKDISKMVVDAYNVENGNRFVIDSWTKYINSDTGHISYNMIDVGFLFIDKPINLLSYPKLVLKSIDPYSYEYKVQVIGRMKDGARTNYSWISHPQTINRLFEKYYLFNAVTDPGDSGGGVFLADTNMIIGTHSGSTGKESVAAPLYPLEEDIIEILQKQSTFVCR